MVMPSRRTACIVFWIVMLSVSVGDAPAVADVIMVVSAKSAMTTLTRDEAGDIFLGKTSRFRSGEQAVPIDQVEGSSARGEFYATMAGKSAAQLKAYWSKMIFTGRGQPPKEVAGSDEVKKFVASHAAAIGYIDRSALDGTVKALTVSP